MPSTKVLLVHHYVISCTSRASLILAHCSRAPILCTTNLVHHSYSCTSTLVHPTRAPISCTHLVHHYSRAPNSCITRTHAPISCTSALVHPSCAPPISCTQLVHLYSRASLMHPTRASLVLMHLYSRAPNSCITYSYTHLQAHSSSHSRRIWTIAVAGPQYSGSQCLILALG